MNTVVETRDLAGTVNLKIVEKEVVGFSGDPAKLRALFKALALEIEFSSGELFLNGVNVKNSQRQLRATVAHITESDHFDPGLSFSGNIEIYAKYFGVNRAQVRTSLRHWSRKLGVSEWLHAYPADFSKKYLWQMSVLRALCVGVRFILFDVQGLGEGLDKQSVEEFFSELKTQPIGIAINTMGSKDLLGLCDRQIEGGI